MSVKCKHCDAELPDEAKFCLSCGRSVDMLVLEPVKPPSGSDTDTRAVILLAFGIFTMMIGVMMIMPVLLIGGSHLWLLAALPFAVGASLLAIRYYVLHSYAHKVENLREEVSAKVRCRYCGSLNAQAARKCESCGATL